MSKGFAVAAGSRLAAESAAEVLRAGGSAVDAAIAAAFAACVAEPVLAGPFGGGFLMVREPGGRASLLDFFVQTPKARRPDSEADLREISADFGDATQSFLIGAASIAAPGMAAGLAEAHARLGRMPMRDLAAPAVKAASEGRALEAFQARVLAIAAPIYVANADMRAVYCAGGDAPLKSGETYANPVLGDLLDAWSREGARFMQQGEPAAALLGLCADGGHLARDDMAGYAAEWRAPTRAARGAAEIALNPPPSTGGALIAFALAMLDDRPDAAAIARAFAATTRARAAAGPDEEAARIAEKLADPALIARFRRDAARAPFAPRGTTHISVVDATGAGAALSLSNGEGAGVIVPGCGVTPNNMLGELDLIPEAGRWPRDRRLSSMMAPSLISWPDGRAALLGSGGSNRIRSAVAQVALRLIDEGARLEDAIAAPRLHVDDGPEGLTLDAEDRFSEADRAALAQDWPVARFWAEDSMFYGGVHAVARDARGGVEAFGDPRRAGVAITG